jgi:hypothetical protein
MGLPELVATIAARVLEAMRFVLYLCMGSKKAWGTFRQFARRPTLEQQNACDASKRRAKDKYRPRRMNNGDGTTRLAELGEKGGMLYDVMLTPMRSMQEFGLGIAALYYVTAGYAVILTIQFFLVTPSFLHYSSREYSDEQRGIPIYLVGSAVCTRRENVVAWNPETGANETLSRNMCQVTALQGYMNLACLALFGVCMAIFWKKMDRKLEEMDEALQSAQDYTVVCEHPPADAVDTEEWYQFFSQFGEVASITIAVDNHELLDCLVQRRVASMGAVMAGAQTDNADAGGGFDLASWIDQEMGKLTNNIESLMQVFSSHKEDKNKAALEACYEKTCPAVFIFCIFEDETSQRNCLQSLTTGWLSRKLSLATVKEEHKFRGLLLSVAEASEPTEVMYAKLRRHDWTHNAISIVSTAFSSLVVCYGCGVLVGYFVVNHSIYMTALVVSAIKEALPHVIKATTDHEIHGTHSGIEVAIMNKTFLFEIMTGPFAIYVYSAFTNTLDVSYLDQVQQILIFDSIAAPIWTFWQPITYFQRKFIAPLTQSEIQQENYYRGQEVRLGEELAHRTAGLMLSLFYVALLPAGLVVSVLSFTIAYWMNKHGLFRRWTRMPTFGSRLVATTKAHTAVSLVGAVIISGRFYAGWPFDEVCSKNGVAANGFYKCDRTQKPFLNHPQSWMTEDQQAVVTLYNRAGILLILAFAVWWIGFAAGYGLKALLYGGYDSVGDSQDIPYTTVIEIQGYVPAIEVPMLDTPLICCDRSGFDSEYIHFQVEYDNYDLYLEVKCELEKKGEEKKLDNLFSKCRFYPTVSNPDPLMKRSSGQTQLGTLWVYVDKAAGIVGHKALTGKSDPVIKMRYMKNEWKTKTCRNTVDPLFQETFAVQVRNTLSHEREDANYSTTDP